MNEAHQPATGPGRDVVDPRYHQTAPVSRLDCGDTAIPPLPFDRHRQLLWVYLKLDCHYEGLRDGGGDCLRVHRLHKRMNILLCEFGNRGKQGLPGRLDRLRALRCNGL